ncbi:ribulose-phosphate 3-epimerase [Meiothermus sp.]|uniref:ribulose-phosphate 3-epimerase n=1 Tax=Meiothermus sp. TaxID=1955249 RepID=UPI00307D2E62
MPQIAPSILASDFTRLGEQVLACAEAGAELIHVDVMDGRFVPNISMGLVVEALRRMSPLPLDAHLMIVEPERYIADFAKAGAHYLTFHPEATPHAHRVLQQIKEQGVRAGMAVNPGTPLEYFVPLLGDLDLALLMTVNPGFGGQKFIEGSLERLRVLKQMRDQLNPECLLEVDGGINRHTAPQVVAHGADILVAGSAVFDGNTRENIALLRESYAFAS